jgi:hypothetical protein
VSRQSRGSLGWSAIAPAGAAQEALGLCALAAAGGDAAVAARRSDRPATGRHDHGRGARRRAHRPRARRAATGASARGVAGGEGRIGPDTPDELWATDPTGAWTRLDRRFAVFVIVDHCTGEVWVDAAPRMDRWAAADLLREAILDRFGSVETGAATGLKLRRLHPHEPVDQGGPPAPAHPARDAPLDRALPSPCRGRARIRTAQERVGPVTAPRPGPGSRPAARRPDDPRQARLYARAGASRSARGLAALASSAPFRSRPSRSRFLCAVATIAAICLSASWATACKRWASARICLMNRT